MKYVIVLIPLALLCAFLAGRVTAPVVKVERPIIVQRGEPCDNMAARDPVADFLSGWVTERELDDVNFAAASSGTVDVCSVQFVKR